jgi:hypothetical protein
MFTSPEYGMLRDEAERQGADHGASLAEWWWQDTFGGRGRGTKPQAEQMLRAFEEGDPAVYDSIPSVDFSGQWADGPNWEEVFSALVWDAIRVGTDDITETDDLDCASEDCFLIYTEAADVMTEQRIVDQLTDFVAS